MGEMADLQEEQDFNLAHLPETHRRRPKPAWKTRDGQIILVESMETSHILNCIKMLEKIIASRPDPYAYGEPEGDAAQDAFNAGIRDDEYREAELRRQVKIFNNELSRREP